MTKIALFNSVTSNEYQYYDPLPLKKNFSITNINSDFRDNKANLIKNIQAC